MAAAFVAACTPAEADEWTGPTTQAVAYNADWVPYLDPPEKPAAVCLVDSGVNVTPDTPADSPTGPILKRLALDGGPGTAASDTWEGLHGTRMAFVGAAPINGWGAVGFWPGARIVSIRAMPQNESNFPFDNYSRAIGLCTKQAGTLNIAVVNLSLACACEPTQEERARLDEQVGKAHNNGESVVAAVGNGGGPVGSPAIGEGVLAVAAGNATHGLCGFSNRGTAVDVLAPGCNVDMADPHSGHLWSDYASGTSGAAISTSVILALVRSYRTDLDARQVERLLVQATSPEVLALDVEAVFRAAGLGNRVNSAKARLASASSLSTSARNEAGPTQAASFHAPTADPWPDSETQRPGRFPTPTLRSKRRHGMRLTLRMRNRPRAAYVAVLAERIGRSDFTYSPVARVERIADTVTIRLPGRGGKIRLQVRYFLPKQPSRSSLVLYQQVDA